MSERTVLVIDYDIVIPEGKEKLFEDQHIRLTGGIKCEGRLVFKNCVIEPAPDVNSARVRGMRNVCVPGSICMGINGELEIYGCEVIRPSKEFLLGRAMTIQNTSFILAPLSEVIITAHGETRFRNCSFTEDVPSAEQATHNLICSSDVNM